MQPLDSCRAPSCEYAKPRKPARKNTGHEMCDLARDMNRAMRVVEKRTTEDVSEVQLDSITEQPSREGCLG